MLVVTTTQDDARSEENSVLSFTAEEVSEPGSPTAQSDTASEEQSAHTFDSPQDADMDPDDDIDGPLCMDFDDFLPDTANGIESGTRC